MPAQEHEQALRLRAFLRHCPRLCGGFSIFVGTIVLAAWWLGRPQLTAVVAGLPVMRPNTAIMAILAGASLILLAPIAASRRRAVAGKICAGIAGSIAALTAAEYAFGLGLGIDRVVFTPEEFAVRGYPRRPSVEAAAAFAAIAAALVTINRKTARGLCPAEILVLFSGLMSLIALLGYLFNITALYGAAPLLPYTGMSIPTALAVFALSAGIMSARVDVGAFSILVAQDSGGIAARQLMGSLVVFVPVVCAMALAISTGVFSAPFATALIVLVATVGGSGLILRVSWRLSHLDTERRKAEAQLRLSQERLDLALRGANIATWDWNVTTGEVIVSRRWPEMRGFPPGDLLQHVDSWISSVHPDDWPGAQKTLTDHLEGRIPEYETEHRVQTRAGEWIWVLVRGKVFERDEQGRPTRMAGTALDITSRKQFEEEQRFLAEAGAILTSSLEYEQTLTSVAQLAVRDLAEVCAVDLVEEGEVRRLKVVTRDPSKAWICDLLIHVKFDRTQPLLIWTVLKTKQPVLLETVPPEMIEAWSRIGEYRRVLEAMPLGSILAVPLLVRGNPLGIIGLVRSTASRPFGSSDLRVAQALAERAALSIENARNYRAAQRAIEARDHVMGIVAHDLRNPLAAILLQAAGLRRRGPGPERRSHEPVELIARSARRMSRLIRDLLDVASIEAGSLAVECSRVAGNQLVSDSVDAHKALASSAALEFRLELANELPEVWGDRERLLQVFENLIGNAVKFTEPGGRITVGAAPRDPDVLFWVSDTGPGIETQHLAHVFERFWQARKDSRHGAGLGLPIVKGVVEAHGGRIWVESAPGRGSTFFFTIPKAPRSQESSSRGDMTQSAA